MSIPVGAWLSIYTSPEAVRGCLPLPSARRIAGQVIGCKPLPHFQPGNIPTCAVTIRGRSGRTATLDFTACYGTVHASQAGAIAEATP